MKEKKERVDHPRHHVRKKVSLRSRGRVSKKISRIRGKKKREVGKKC